MAGEAADEEAARLLGVCEHVPATATSEGLDGLVDKRLGQVSARRAPVDEVVRTEALYREPTGGTWRTSTASTVTWVKSTLQRRRRGEASTVGAASVRRLRG